MKGRLPASAEIVAVGTEILLGGLLDTNTAWLGRRLAALGVAVHRHTAVGDDEGRLVAGLSEAAARADLVLSTGGLGPTRDALTHEALGLATGRGMVEYPGARRHPDEAFERFTRMGPEASAKGEEYTDKIGGGGSMIDQTRCPRCRHANPPENRFCGSCGALLRAGSDLVARRRATPTAIGRTLPTKLGPAGNAVAVGLAAMALRAGVSWLRHRTAAGGHPSAPTARGPDTAVCERLLVRSLEEVLIGELNGDQRSRAFARRAVRSTVISRPIDKRSWS